jgi:hypothetical protein
MELFANKHLFAKIKEAMESVEDAARVDVKGAIAKMNIGNPKVKSRSRGNNGYAEMRVVDIRTRTVRGMHALGSFKQWRDGLRSWMSHSPFSLHSPSEPLPLASTSPMLTPRIKMSLKEEGIARRRRDQICPGPIEADVNVIGAKRLAQLKGTRPKG